MTATDPATTKQTSYITDLLTQAGLAGDHVPTQDDLAALPRSVQSATRVRKMARRHGGTALADLAQSKASEVIEGCREIHRKIGDHNSLPYTTDYEVS